MSPGSMEQWYEDNQRYLSRATRWIRMRLLGLASSIHSPAPAPDTIHQPQRAWWQIWKTEAVTPLGSPMAHKVINSTAFERPQPHPWWQFWRQTSPAPAVAVSVPEPAPDEQASLAMTTDGMEHPPALLMLADRLQLSPFERDVLLLCASVELDHEIAELCALAQSHPGIALRGTTQMQPRAHRPYPTFSLTMALFEQPCWDVLSPERPLRYWRLIEINQPGAEPLTTSALRADERIVNYLTGVNYLDDRLSPLLSRLSDAVAPELPPSQKMVAEAINAVLRRHIEQKGAQWSGAPVIQLLGPDAASKQLMARHVAAAYNLQLFRLPVELLPAASGDLETLARLWARESLLGPVALYLDTIDTAAGSPAEGQAQALRRFLTRSDGLFFVDSRDLRSDLGRSALAFDLAKPVPGEQEAAWAVVLGKAGGNMPALLAGQFNMNLGTIQEIGRAALAKRPNYGHRMRRRLWEACLESTRPSLDVLAQRLDPKATRRDIVLPKAEKDTLLQIADQVAQRSQVYNTWGFRDRMNRGLGISALFAGESGTGKTMAAEVIANRLCLNLYRIDLSAVVSKYIGETEKNLRRLFDAAEDGGAILFFDEADALFGKRSEVKDSHDRYANIEINYLLQRMEAYGGLAILATNMKSALDPAFVRRLRFIVNFPFPGAQDRKRIWQKAFPAQTPTATLDFDRLSRWNLTGGSIHNITLNAAFMAARLGTPVTMEVVLEAARAEFRKLDRPINKTEFQ